MSRVLTTFRPHFALPPLSLPFGFPESHSFAAHFLPLSLFLSLSPFPADMMQKGVEEDATRRVAIDELRTLPKGRATYARRGNLFFLQPRRDVLKAQQRKEKERAAEAETGK